MPDIFLESSAVIELLFRDQVRREKVKRLLPRDAVISSSRYVVFEVARNYLRTLILLLNKCRVAGSLDRLFAYMHEGQQLFRKYASQSMLGAYRDYLAHWQEQGESLTAEQQLADFQGWLDNHLRSGWRQLNNSFLLLNVPGCKDSLPSFSRRPNGDVDQQLPTDQCGTATACGLSQYLVAFRSDFDDVLSALKAMPDPDNQTVRRIEALSRLLAKTATDDFTGKDCYACGDAIICHEAPQRAEIVSKNAKHFRPICSILAKRLLSYT